MAEDALDDRVLGSAGAIRVHAPGCADGAARAVTPGRGGEQRHPVLLNKCPSPCDAYE
jgi:hypothetical protein